MPQDFFSRTGRRRQPRYDPAREALGAALLNQRPSGSGGADFLQGAIGGLVMARQNARRERDEAEMRRIEQDKAKAKVMANRQALVDAGVSPEGALILSQAPPQEQWRAINEARKESERKAAEGREMQSRAEGLAAAHGLPVAGVLKSLERGTFPEQLKARQESQDRHRERFAKPAPDYRQIGGSSGQVIDMNNPQGGAIDIPGFNRSSSEGDGGGLPDLNDVVKLRNEWGKIAGTASEINRQASNINTAYERGVATGDWVAADQAIVATFNKILDPTSVVRESEFARTAAGQSLLQRYIGKFERATAGGAGLTDQNRKELVALANAIAEKANEYVAGQHGPFSSMVTSYGIEPSHVFGSYAPPSPPAAASPAAAGGSPFSPDNPFAAGI